MWEQEQREAGLFSGAHRAAANKEVDSEQNLGDKLSPASLSSLPTRSCTFFSSGQQHSHLSPCIPCSFFCHAASSRKVSRISREVWLSLSSN